MTVERAGEKLRRMRLVAGNTCFDVQIRFKGELAPDVLETWAKIRSLLNTEIAGAWVTDDDLTTTVG